MNLERTCTILDGRSVAAADLEALRHRVSALKAWNGSRMPILATLLVGDDPSSATYVKMKGNACHRVGMDSRVVKLDQTASTADVLREIDPLNADQAVHGILLQHPVPSHVDERQCFDRISLSKDVDGVTSHGFGLMAMGRPAFGSATSAGIMRLLAHYDLSVSGLRAVVVGRSPILGKPLSMMMLNSSATVTVCHAKTSNLAEEIHRAEVIVGAVGRPNFIRSEWIRDGAIVIDAGYHAGGVGDIQTEGLVDRCRALTPCLAGLVP